MNEVRFVKSQRQNQHQVDDFHDAASGENDDRAAASVEPENFSMLDQDGTPVGQADFKLPKRHRREPFSDLVCGHLARRIRGAAWRFGLSAVTRDTSTKDKSLP